jgi:hypothetical protein
VAVFGAVLRFAVFRGFFLFCASFFAGVTFRPVVLFNPVDFFLVFFLVAIRAV